MSRRVRSRYRRGATSHFFPSDLKSTAHVISYLARYDELIGLGALIDGMSHSPTDLGTMLALVRFQIVSAHDATEHAVALGELPDFSAALSLSEDLNTLFRANLATLAASRQLRKIIRDKTAAHIDARDLAKALRTEGENIIGGLWLSTKATENRFPVAHLAVLALAAHHFREVDPSLGHMSVEDVASRILHEGAEMRFAVIRLFPAVFHAYQAVGGHLDY